MSFVNQLRQFFLFSQAEILIEKSKIQKLTELDAIESPEIINPKSEKYINSNLDYSTGKKLILSLIKSFKGRLGIALIFTLSAALFNLLGPFLINKFVKYIENYSSTSDLKYLILLSIVMSFSSYLNGLFSQHYFFQNLFNYQLFGNIISRKIFQRSLKLSYEERQENQIGDIVNYLGSDSDYLADVCFVLLDSIQIFFTLLLVAFSLFFYLGFTAFVPFIMFVLLIPVTKLISKKLISYGRELMSCRDERVTLLTQILNSIRLVKFYSWEKSSINQVSKIRDQELMKRKTIAQMESFSTVIYVAASTLILFVTFYVHHLRGFHLSTGDIFSCLLLFGILEEPFGAFAFLISRWSNTVSSAQRISEFVVKVSESHGNEKFAENENPNLNKNNEQNESPFIKVIDLSVCYKNSAQNALEKISFSIPSGSSLAVVGEVGSGKSSLLLALLNEVSFDGQIQFLGKQNQLMHPKLSYVPQESFIFNETLANNIYFGNSINENRLKSSLHCVGLDEDMHLWQGGEEIEIGEKGINLSGGQKQRVALARAHYQNPDVIFLDDPLSAVDVNTEKQICNRLIFSEWKNKTRIVVTHRLEHLKNFDQILFLEQGKIKAQGSWDEIIKNPEFQVFYSHHEKSDSTVDFKKDSSDSTAVNIQNNINEHISKTTKEDFNNSTKSMASKITVEEERIYGKVAWKVFWLYLKAMGGEVYGGFILTLMIFGMVVVTLLPLGQRAWLSSLGVSRDQLNGIYIFGLIGLFMVVISLLNRLFWLSRGIYAGKQFHEKMLNSIMKTGIRFFDSNPVGRILQRFTRDMESVDLHLQWSFQSGVECIIQILVSFTLIIVSFPIVILFFIPVLIYFYIIQDNYRRPAREMKRLDSLARSPRYAHFKETLQGLIVIRAFHKTQWAQDLFIEKLFKSQRMFFSHTILNRWYSSRVPFTGALVSLLTTGGVIWSVSHSVISAGFAGLLTIYALNFWRYLNWAVRIFSDIESRMTSIERLLEYSVLPSEEVQSKNYCIGWPTKGKIEFKNVSARYSSDLPLVLKNISFTADSSEKVGILGRTGSGKSTLIQLLFRFIEPENGEILIDGENIKEISLEQLRQSISIIPQDPTLFIGTIRSNLDPYNQYKDEQIVQALKDASLWNLVERLPNQILAPVSEGGGNFSQGQRQLFCLARALLLKTKIIVLDEASSNVDVATDAQLQEVIRQKLQGVTILVIAHRLGTLNDCDKTIQLSYGEIIGG